MAYCRLETHQEKEYKVWLRSPGLSEAFWVTIAFAYVPMASA